MPSPIGSTLANRSQPTSRTSGPIATPSLPPQTQTSPPTAQSTCRPSHLSDFTQTDKLRGGIDQQAQNNPSLYGWEVRGVNHVLKKSGIGISCDSYQSVTNNLKQVHDGTIPEYTAHWREATTFAQDAFQSFTHGQVTQGAVETLGAVLNTDASVYTLPQGLVEQAGGAIASGFQSIKQWLWK